MPFPELFPTTRIATILGRQDALTTDSRNCNDVYDLLPNDHPEREVDDPQLIMTVEYTPSSFTAAIWVEQCGEYDLQYKVTSTDSEYNRYMGLACWKTGREEVNCDAAALQAAFSKLAKKSGRGRERKMGVVLIYGSKADDDELLSSLRHVLTEEFSNGATVDLSRIRAFSSDPAFAGSRAMAVSDLRNKVYQQYRAEHGLTEHDEL